VARALSSRVPLTRPLRRWWERDDLHLVKRAAPEIADPIDELPRIINETQERDAEDERRLYPVRLIVASARSPVSVSAGQSFRISRSRRRLLR